MTGCPRSRLVSALAAALVLGACAHRGGAAPAPAPSRSPAELAELERIARAREDSARHRYVQADVDFMSGMIMHHAQAITMSRLAPTHGASPSVRTLAARIINAQQDEIVTMQGWLRDRGLAVPEVHDMGGELMVHGAGHEGMGLMPGMLTPAQMTALGAAQGEAFDRLFLTGMIQHHNGAVQMVKQLFATYGAGQDEQVFKFASDVNVDQTTEIARMEKMLAALPAATGAP